MPKFKYSSDHEYDGYLKVNSCGKQWFTDRDWDIPILKGRVDYSIRYVIKGKGYCEIDGQYYPVPEGSVMIHYPNEMQHLRYKKEDQTVTAWVHFSGTACEALTKYPLKTPAIIKIIDRKQFESAFDNMIISHYKKNDFSELLSNGYTQVILSLLIQSILLSDQSKKSSNKNSRIQKNETMEKIISYMHENYNKPIDIQEYATMCYVCEDHFIRLFKSYTGLPPYRYQLKIRISRAIELLENSSISVKDCAETVGFDDPAYFSKVFKRLTGHSPSEYIEK